MVMFYVLAQIPRRVNLTKTDYHMLCGVLKNACQNRQNEV